MNISNLYVDDVLRAEPNITDVHMKTADGYRIQLEHIVASCELIPDTVRTPGPQENRTLYKCSDIAPVVVSMQEGQKCFTFFSDMFGDMKRALAKEPTNYLMQFERFPFIELKLKNKYLQGLIDSIGEKFFTNDSANADVQAGIFIALHSATILPNILELNYHRLTPSKMIKVSFLKTIQELQPPPYKTNCINYKHREEKVSQNEILVMNYRPASDYESRGECFIYCMWIRLNIKDCINFFSIFTSEPVILVEKMFNELIKKMNGTTKDKYLTFCPFTEKTFEDYQINRKACLQECRSPCYQELFSINNIDNYNTDTEDYTMMQIEWSTEAVVHVQHKVKLGGYTFLGNFGGHAHIWLGISVIHFAKHILHLIETGKYLPIIKRFFRWLNWFRK